MHGEGWDDYLGSFHRGRPGITETVLAHAKDDDGTNPYDWLAQALPGGGLVVDVACGSGPLAACGAHRWVGLDRNPAELRLAAQTAPGRAVLADAAAPPLRAGAADAVACSMALMVFDDPARTTTEMARLLRDGGRFVALLPATTPLTLRDRARYARLLAALRLRRLPFPHHHLLHDARPLMSSAGLTLTAYQPRRFAYPLTPGRSDLLLRSLYLPRLDPQRRRAGEQVARRWTGTNIGIPLCRLVATKNP